MARKRKKEDVDKLEQLERDNKSLRTLNRSLMRQLKKLNRDINFEELSEEETFEDIPKNQCPQCTRGTIKEVDLGPRKFSRCEVCNYRTKTIKNK